MQRDERTSRPGPGPLPAGSAISDDPLGAFCRHAQVSLRGSGKGPLAGLGFAVKDVFDIAGHRTGAGNPDWLRTHPPASVTAPAVQALLDAGADMVGKTKTDELAYSLIGQNAHYGTPANPGAPGRVPGGSSSGSVAATAGGLVDFALGTDCGGSVRLPASLCGCLGFRPTHGRIPLDGIVPLAPSFDTVGWFARDSGALRTIGSVLFDEPQDSLPRGRLLYAVDLFALASPAAAAALAPAVAAARRVMSQIDEVSILDGIEADRVELFRILQGREVWRHHGAWIESTRPQFGPGVKERFELASRITEFEVSAAAAIRVLIRERLDRLLGDDNVICLPTSPDIAPSLDTPLGTLNDFRARAIRLLSPAGLAGLPQVSLPLAVLDGCPMGLSLIGPRGRDSALLALIEAMMPRAS